MNDINKLFHIKFARDKMTAEIWYNKENRQDFDQLTLTETDLIRFLKDNHISFGVKKDTIQKIIKERPLEDFPIEIAEGIEKIDGEDGKLNSVLDTTTEVDRSDGWNFREVMRIPSVQRGEKLATLIPPTKGFNGKTVQGKEIYAKPGKPMRVRAGKNVTFNEQDQTFYATAEGQVEFGINAINVFPVYEVLEDISMKTGNIDFIGTVVIRGDVPTGFTVKAAGDIKIFGLVEAATIIADGSIFISEGMAGLKTGLIQADEDVHIGYVNQGKIIAGKSIFVENSILHSDCTATKDIICKQGHIIGGSLSAGRTMEAKDVGNRMNTLTQLSFGTDKKLHDQLQKLEEEKKKLTENIRKLKILKEKMEVNKEQQTSKSKITLLKLRYSYTKTKEQLSMIEEQLSTINVSLGNKDETYLRVKGSLYSNVIVSFGKYKRTINKNYDHVTIKMDNNDIVIIPYS